MEAQSWTELMILVRSMESTMQTLMLPWSGEVNPESREIKFTQMGTCAEIAKDVHMCLPHTGLERQCHWNSLRLI